MKFELKGTPAIIAIVLITIGVLGYRAFLHTNLPKDPKIRQQLEINLMSEIAGGITADTEAIKQAMSSGDNEKASALAQGMLKRKVGINKLALKGGGNNIIVKANYTIYGPNAPKKKTGFFKYSHSPITGWRYRQKVTALSWYLKLI